MIVAHNEIQMGDILVFKRKGFVSGMLGPILKLFKKKWDGWGWHMGIAWEESKHANGLWILEATGDGVRVGLLSEDKLKNEIRAYRWLDEPPSDEVMEKFMADNLDKGYDVVVYFWTLIQRGLLRVIKRSIPRILNDKYTCWELAFLFAREMNKPIRSILDYPLLTDFLEAVEEREAAQPE